MVALDAMKGPGLHTPALAMRVPNLGQDQELAFHAVYPLCGCTLGGKAVAEEGKSFSLPVERIVTLISLKSGKCFPLFGIG
jgi:hypothetical protein